MGETLESEGPTMSNFQYLLTANEYESEVCYIGWRLDGGTIIRAADLAVSMLCSRKEARAEHQERVWDPDITEYYEEAVSYQINATIEEVVDWFDSYGIREDESITFWDGPFQPAGTFTLNPDQQLAFKLRWL